MFVAFSDGPQCVIEWKWEYGEEIIRISLEHLTGTQQSENKGEISEKEYKKAMKKIWEKGKWLE